MSSELGEAAARTETATESIEDSAEDLSSELGEAATDSELATESIESSAQDMSSELGQAAAKTEAATESIESSLRDLPSGQRLNQLGEQAERAGRNMTEAGQRIATAGGAMLAPIAGAVTQAGRFEEAMVEVQKVTDETTAENLAGPIEEMSTRIPRASTELASLAADAARFGVQGEKNILAFTESTAKMATATDLSTEEAGTAFAKLATLTDTPIPKVENLGSSINALSNNMATSSQEIVDSMLRSSQALDNLGLSATEMPAISAALNEVSESSERAGTRLKRFAQELLNPDKAQNIASALGMTAGQFTQMREESPVELIRQMATSFNEGGQQADQLRSVLSSVSRQTLSGLAANIDNLDSALGRSAEQFEENTSLTREFEAATETLFNQLTLLWNRTKRFARLVGAELLPAVTSAARSVSNFLEPVNEWVQANPELTKQLALVTVAVGGLLTVIGGGLAVLGFFAQGIGAGISALGTMAEFFTSGSALLSGLKSFTASITTAGGALSGLITGLGALVGGGLLTGLGILAAIGTAIFKVWRPLAAFFQGFFEGFAQELQPVLRPLRFLWSRVTLLGDALMRLLSPIGQSVSEFEGMMTAGRDLGSLLGWLVSGVLVRMIETIATGVRAFENIISTVNETVSAIANGNWLEAGKAIISGIAEGIQTVAPRLWDTMKGIASGIRDFLPFSPAKRGPLSDLDETGPAMISTIAQGLDGSPLQQRLDAVLQGVDGRALTLGLRPDVEVPELPQVEGQIPTPSPMRTSEAAEQVARQEIEMPERSGRPRREPRSKPRPIQVTVNNETEVTMQGDADPGEVQQAVQEGSDDVVRKVKRALEEEKRTGF